MVKLLNDIQAANRRYAENTDQDPVWPRVGWNCVSILTCMEASLEPARFGVGAECDGHVVRNAGGRATDDAIRSLLLSHELHQTQEWLVIHHTGCALQNLNERSRRRTLTNHNRPVAG